MLPRSPFRSCSLLLFAACLWAQDPTPPAPAMPPGDALRKAFVDADGARRGPLTAAAETVLATDAAGRLRFLTLLRELAAATPAATKVPGPAPKPVELGEATRQHMATAIGDDAEQRRASLAALAADATEGTPALAQLGERGKAILARCVATFVRKQVETNAVFAGQYAALRDFQPEAGELLLRWGKAAPRDAVDPDPFRTACLRALRDVLTAEQANERVRAELREIAQLAQAGRNQDWFLTTVCALQQFGDPSLFDTIKAGVREQAEKGDEQERAQATNMLAELHYLARQYEDAANHYKAFVALVEKAPQPPETLPTTIYNCACSLALAGKTDEALQYLAKALDAGARSPRPLSKVLLDTDHDIDGLRQDARFTALYEQHFGKGKPATK